MALLDKLSLDKDSDEEFDFEADDVGLEKDLSFRTSQSRAAFTRRLPYFAAEFKKRWNNLNTCMVLIVFGLVILLILPSKGGVRPEIALNDVNNLTPKCKYNRINLDYTNIHLSLVLFHRRIRANSCPSCFTKYFVPERLPLHT